MTIDKGWFTHIDKDWFTRIEKDWFKRFDDLRHLGFTEAGAVAVIAETDELPWYLAEALEKAVKGREKPVHPYSQPLVKTA